jgi:hypothetical protein
MKIIRLRKSLTVILNDGTILTVTDCTDTMYNEVVENQEDEKKVRCLLVPEFCKQEAEFQEKIQEVEEVKTFIEEVKEKNDIFTYEDGKVYIKSISDLTVPQDLVRAINAAIGTETKKGNPELLQSYLNFWTLASLNPDAEARKNLFWFLNKYGMKISKSGLFVAYRNVVVKDKRDVPTANIISEELAAYISATYVKIKGQKKSPKNYFVIEDGENKSFYVVKDPESVEKGMKNLGTVDALYLRLGEINVAGEDGVVEDNTPTYTDAHSKSFTIKIGKPVTMPRKDCDPIQSNTCSRGLHVAGKKWLEDTGTSFGSVGLMVLVNPADVVAVPPNDSYGKMRCCAYYPVMIVEKQNGRIVSEDIPEGFEDNFMELISYDGEVNNNDAGNYKLEIPTVPSLNKVNILSRLADIKKSLSTKYVK